MKITRYWRTGLLAAWLLAAATAAIAQRAVIKAAYKVSRLSAEAAAVACIDGNDPEIQKFGRVLIVTCHPIEAARGR